MENRKTQGRFAVIAAMLLLAAAAIFMAAIYKRTIGTACPPRSGALSGEELKACAARLKAHGLLESSARAYREYLDRRPVSSAEASGIYFNIGQMFFNAGRYEESLENLTRAEALGPSADLKKDIGRMTVTCLERLGKTEGASYELESRSALKPDKIRSARPGEVVARIGSREITMGELDAQLEFVPPMFKKAIEDSPERKLEFLNQYLQAELLLDKAAKLGIDKDPEVNNRVEDMRRRLVIGRFVEREISSKVTSDETDLKNYFEANKDKYRQRQRLHYEGFLAESEAKAKTAADRIRSGTSFEDAVKDYAFDPQALRTGGKVAAWVYPGTQVPLVGKDPEFNRALFEMKPNEEVRVLKSEKGFYVVRVSERFEERGMTYEEASGQVKAEYGAKKQESLMQALMDRLAEENRVEINEDVFKKKPLGPVASGNNGGKKDEAQVSRSQN